MGRTSKEVLLIRKNHELELENQDLKNENQQLENEKDCLLQMIEELKMKGVIRVD
ncbi:hypothetical protein [Companilactobacillus metriopterae]|uniref:hypothetical protein n=1 Tax=Companilactobacillus metriopterae TaxID=1909267 RepID=UPI0013E95FE8|nr:hypothetical protein [Companilactobacillus metriopterae]